MKPRNLLCNVALLSFAVISMGTAAQAANVSMTADDGFGASSFNSAGKWDNSAAPSAGNAYFNNNFMLRTPADANNYTFAGDSLTITSDQPFGSTTSAAMNDALLYKGTGSGSTLTINDLIVNGGYLRHSNGEAQTFTLAGNLTVGPQGMAVHCQGSIQVTAPVNGSGLIQINNAGNNNQLRKLVFNNTANTFNGSIYLVAQDCSRFQLAPGSNLNFVIGAAGVNNQVYGAGNCAFDGVFNIDLSAASTTLGDSWTLVTRSTLALSNFNSTFSVVGFSPRAGDTWLKEVSGTFYKFSESTGVLQVVPEPATLGLLALGSLLLARRRRA